MKHKKLHRNMVLAVLATTTLISSVVLIGCQPKITSGDKNEGAQEGITVVTLGDWSEETDCSVCHVQQNASLTDAQCMASKHPDASCGECHADADRLSTVHIGASTESTAPTRLSQDESNVVSSTCETEECHSRSDLASATANSTALTDSEGKSVNPHSLPEAGTHTEIDCIDCHTAHNPQESYGEQAKSYCLSCHHADVYDCYTCHD